MGEGREFEVPEALAGERIDRVVALELGASRSAVRAWIAQGRVLIGELEVASGKQRLVPGDLVRVQAPEDPDPRPRPQPEIDIRVVHLDEELIVVDKPAGLTVHPGSGRPEGTLVNGLLARFGELAEVGDPQRPGIVHRLDHDTSGLLVVARTPEAYRALVAALAAREVHRGYQALVGGLPEADAGVIDAPIGRSRREPTRMAVRPDGRSARTHYRVLERFADQDASHLDLELETGRTHQIRVHLGAIGHPVLGDSRYGRQRRGVTRQMLHAGRLGLVHPGSGEPVDIEAPLPEDMAGVLDALRT